MQPRIELICVHVNFDDFVQWTGERLCSLLNLRQIVRTTLRIHQSETQLRSQRLEIPFAEMFYSEFSFEIGFKKIIRWRKGKKLSYSIISFQQITNEQKSNEQTGHHWNMHKMRLRQYFSPIAGMIQYCPILPHASTHTSARIALFISYYTLNWKFVCKIGPEPAWPQFVHSTHCRTYIGQYLCPVSVVVVLVLLVVVLFIQHGLDDHWPNSTSITPFGHTTLHMPGERAKAGIPK